MKIFYTYILECFDKSYYVGSTSNIDKRKEMHDNGKVRSTKYKLPVKIIFLEGFNSLSKANKREFQIKKWKSRKAIEKLVKNT
jgi:putative endonuclease